MSLFIKNPHSVLAALETRPQDVLEVVIAPKETEANDIWQQIRQLATRSRIPVSAQPRKDHGGKNFSKNKAVTRPDESSRLSGTGASIKERAGLSVEELFRVGPANGDTATVPAKLSPASSKSGRSSKSLSAAAGHGIWLALDSLQDPQNVGAIFRSAAFFGVRGILLTQERSVPLTAAVYDIASGGAEYVPFSIQANLQRSFEIAKDAGLWIPWDFRTCPRFISKS